jgi:hypothetical protein
MSMTAHPANAPVKPTSSSTEIFACCSNLHTWNMDISQHDSSCCTMTLHFNVCTIFLQQLFQDTVSRSIDSFQKTVYPKRGLQLRVMKKLGMKSNLSKVTEKGGWHNSNQSEHQSSKATFLWWRWCLCVFKKKKTHKDSTSIHVHQECKTKSSDDSRSSKYSAN